MRQTVEKRLARVGFAVAMCLLGLVGASSHYSLTWLLKNQEWVKHNYTVLENIEAVSSGLKDAERGRRGYVITSDDSFLRTYRMGVQETETVLPRLRQLTGDNLVQQRRLDLLQELITRKIFSLQQSVDLLQEGNTDNDLQVTITREGSEIQTQIQILLDEMQNTERALLQQRENAMASNVRNTIISLGLGYSFSFSLLATTYLLLQKHIRDRQQAEDQLTEKQRFIEQIANTTPSILYIYDIAERRITYTNRKIFELLGYLPESIQQVGAGFFDAIKHPEDIESLAAHHQALVHLKDGDTLDVEYRLQDAQHIWHWFSSRDMVFSRQADGLPQQILGTAQDITERRQISATLHQMNLRLTDQVGTLQQRNQEIMLLSHMSDLLQACLSVEEAQVVIRQTMPLLLPGCVGGLYSISDSRNLVETMATWGHPFNSQPVFPPQDCLALRRGQPYVLNHIDHGLCCKHLMEPLPTSYLCVPMVAQGETIGSLFLGSEQELTETQQQLALTLSRQIALALANLKLRETLQHQSIRDPLTGLFNRRYLEESLDREIRRARRKQHALSVIMLDIDHFKQFNDTFGHDAGDAVLQEVGLFLRSSVRDSDIACRYGGEELTLVLAETSMENAHQRAEYLRMGIKHLKIQHRQQSLGTITLSAGVACFPEHGEAGSDLIGVADQALYRAKREGRDRVVIADSPPPSCPLDIESPALQGS